MNKSLILIAMSAWILGCEDNQVGPELPAPLLHAVTGSALVNTPYGATLNGTVYPRGWSTRYYFEYGTTTLYGMKTPDQDAGSGNDPVPVSAAISGLDHATQYHFRVVAVMQPTDTIPGNDQTFSTNAGVELFPLATGTTWTYHYLNFSYSNCFATRLIGTHVWQVVSRVDIGDSSVYSMMDAVNDTSRKVENGCGPVDTTATVSSRTAPFTIVVTRNDISLNFPESNYWPGHRVPRFVASGSDTLTLDNSDSWNQPDLLVCARAIGIISYTNAHDLNNGWLIRLTLLSMSK